MPRLKMFCQNAVSKLTPQPFMIYPFIFTTRLVFGTDMISLFCNQFYHCRVKNLLFHNLFFLLLFFPFLLEIAYMERKNSGVLEQFHIQIKDVVRNG